MEDEVYETPSASPISLCYAKTPRFLFHYLRSGSRLISMTDSRPRARRIYLIKLMLFSKKERAGGRERGRVREGEGIKEGWKERKGKEMEGEMEGRNEGREERKKERKISEKGERETDKLEAGQ